MIETLAVISIVTFSLAGLTGSIILGAEAIEEKSAPTRLGIGILMLATLMFSSIVFWLAQTGIAFS